MKHLIALFALLCALVGVTPAFSQASIPSNPFSTLNLTSTTTAYGIGTLIANNAAAGQVSLPTIQLSSQFASAEIARVRLSSNDPLSTAWPGQTVQIDFWSQQPTWTNGDRGAWQVASGSGYHVASFLCVFGALQGDGVFCEGVPNLGSQVTVRVPTGTVLYWSAEAITGSGVVTASKSMTLTAEMVQ